MSNNVPARLITQANAFDWKHYHIVYPPGYADVRLYSRGLGHAASLPQFCVHFLPSSDRYVPEPIVVLRAATLSGISTDPLGQIALQIATWQKDKLCALVDKNISRRAKAVAKAAQEVHVENTLRSGTKCRSAMGLIISRQEADNAAGGAGLLVQRLRQYLAYIGAEGDSAALLRLDRSIEMLQSSLDGMIKVYEREGYGQNSKSIYSATTESSNSYDWDQRHGNTPSRVTKSTTARVTVFYAPTLSEARQSAQLYLETRRPTNDAARNSQSHDRFTDGPELVSEYSWR